MFHKTWRGRRNRKPLNTIFQICKRITLSTLFPTSILMQSWLVEYRSISLDHISDRFVNVSRLVTSYTVTIPTKKGKVLATNNLHIRNFRKELVTCVNERRTPNCYVPQIAFLVTKIAFLDVTTVNNNYTKTSKYKQWDRPMPCMMLWIWDATYNHQIIFTELCFNNKALFHHFSNH